MSMDRKEQIKHLDNLKAELFKSGLKESGELVKALRQVPWSYWDRAETPADLEELWNKIIVANIPTNKNLTAEDQMKYYSKYDKSVKKTLNWESMLKNGEITMGKGLDANERLRLAAKYGFRNVDDFNAALSEARKVYVANANDPAKLKEKQDDLHKYSAAVMTNDSYTIEKLKQKYANDSLVTTQFNDMDEDNQGINYAINRATEWVTPRAYEQAVKQTSTGDTWNDEAQNDIRQSFGVDAAENVATALMPPVVGKTVSKTASKVFKSPRGKAIADKMVQHAGDALQTGAVDAGAEGANSLLTDTDYDWSRPIGTTTSTFTLPALADVVIGGGSAFLAQNPKLRDFAEGIQRGLKSDKGAFDKNDAIIDITGQQKNYDKATNPLTDKGRKSIKQAEAESAEARKALDAKHKAEYAAIEAMPNGRDKNHERNLFQKRVGEENQRLNKEEMNKAGKALFNAAAPTSKRQMAQTKLDLDAFERDYGIPLDREDLDEIVTSWRDGRGEVNPQEYLIKQIVNFNRQQLNELPIDEYSKWLYEHPRVAALIEDLEPITFKDDGYSKAGKYVGSLFGKPSDIAARSIATTFGGNSGTYLDKVTPTSRTNDKAVEQYQQEYDKRRQELEARKEDERQANDQLLQQYRNRKKEPVPTRWKLERPIVYGPEIEEYNRWKKEQEVIKKALEAKGVPQDSLLIIDQQ